MTFSDLEFKSHSAGMGGVHALAFFPNGYGASVIKTPFSYGGDAGLYELAVVRGDAAGWSLTYETPITSDTEGHLSEPEVSNLLDKISSLPPLPPQEQPQSGEV